VIPVDYVYVSADAGGFGSAVYGLIYKSCLVGVHNASVDC